MEEEEVAGHAGGYRSKIKNPTQFCGEKDACVYFVGREQFAKLAASLLYFLPVFISLVVLFRACFQPQKDDDDRAGIFPTRMGLLGSRMGASLVF